MRRLRISISDTASGRKAEFLFESSPVRLGRNGVNDLVLDFDFVSQCHAAISFTADQVVYMDLGSRNGTTVDGNRAQKHRGVKVQETAQLCVGTLVIQAARVDLDPAAPPAGASAEVKRVGPAVFAPQAQSEDVGRSLVAAAPDGPKPTREFSLAQIPPRKASVSAAVAGGGGSSPHPPAVDVTRASPPAGAPPDGLPDFGIAAPLDLPPFAGWNVPLGATPDAPPSGASDSFAETRSSKFPSFPPLPPSFSSPSPIPLSALAAASADAPPEISLPSSFDATLDLDNFPRHLLRPSLQGIRMQLDGAASTAPDAKDRRLLASALDVLVTCLSSLMNYRSTADAFAERLGGAPSSSASPLARAMSADALLTHLLSEPNRQADRLREFTSDLGQLLDQQATWLQALANASVPSQSSPSQSQPPAFLSREVLKTTGDVAALSPVSPPSNPRSTPVPVALPIALINLASELPDPSFALTKDRVVIGRNEESDLCLRNGSVSRTHAMLTRESTGWEIEDLGSSNGIFINGKPLRHGQGKERLAAGDILQIGQVQLMLV